MASVYGPISGGIIGLLLILSGCGTFGPALRPLPPDAIRPVVAVTDFDNDTGFAGQWKLGRGIPDLLVTELLKTDRVVVVDRKNLNDVVGEIMRQGHDLFRKEDSVTRGRLKNARYLIRGVITDFTQTGSQSGWFRAPAAAVGIRGAQAIVLINITITDVETGEILASIPADGTARASSKWAKFDYKNVSFGGDLFFQTPIGRATQEAIGKAVYHIVQAIPYKTWKPRIAETPTPDTVIINGGENAGVKEGDVFDVREEGRPITDPTTGNIIGHVPGQAIGQIKLTKIGPESSEGIALSGRPKRGDFLEKTKP